MTDRTAEIVHGLRRLLGDDMRSVADRLRGPKKRRPLKHISNRTCSGKDVVCMPGLNGNCIACADEE